MFVLFVLKMEGFVKIRFLAQPFLLIFFIHYFYIFENIVVNVLFIVLFSIWIMIKYRKYTGDIRDALHLKQELRVVSVCLALIAFVILLGSILGIEITFCY
jgi:hypothetical protein